ncbi:type II toxin-antitoxin system Phd/YefM family antitoxin [Tersicoccus sp. Bi-70]|uniref:type II toxin-antitoxin system Phd/YefM family antitoxin n=1 Tax=Tersicoccus sp. Bi-70 TaxID=1897634 RepID=UPI0009766454|nr:type II toxin-antitoxin system prevent-host-death family antitoxin [Tersicoccus sp. Bi-70]OMH34548.1 antitoxin [Tersicoccus sp. Bi-70]
MSTVNVAQAKGKLSELVARAEAGEDIVIARAGHPAVRLVPVEAQIRRFGLHDFSVPDDFDAPLPDEERAAWE